jgi:hypothetical protein
MNALEKCIGGEEEMMTMTGCGRKCFYLNFQCVAAGQWGIGGYGKRSRRLEAVTLSSASLPFLVLTLKYQHSGIGA